MTGMLIALVSAKGSPGVTTAALSLAASTGDATLMVEIDPSGGSIECWTGTTSEPGLLRVASGLRRSLEADVVIGAIRTVPSGVSVVHAPTSGILAESTIAAIGERMTIAMAESNRVVILDAGRWCRSQSTARRVIGCDAVAIVCQPTLSGVESARALIEPIQAVTGQAPVLLLIGERPYSAAEVSAATGVMVIGVLPWDPGSVNTLLTSGTSRGWSRSRLARSACTVLANLTPRPATARTVVAS